MIKTTTRFASFALALVLAPAAAFAQEAPARTCQGTFNALRASMGDTPRCLTAPEADQLQRLCAPGSLRVDNEYATFVRATPSCQAIDLNVLAYRPSPSPLCEMGSTPVTRAGVTVSCACPTGTVSVHAGRHYGCAVSIGYATDLTLQVLAGHASDEQCAHAGITPEECTAIRARASSVSTSTVEEFNAHFTRIEDRLTRVEGVASVANSNALTALREVREVRQQVNRIEQAQARDGIRIDDAHAHAERADARSERDARGRTRHAIGVGTLVLATNGSAYPYALATVAWQMRVPLTSAGHSFFVLDAQAGIGGAERFGLVLGGSLAATLEYCPADEFCFGAGLVGTGMGILWRDPRFTDGNNAAWAAGLRMPIRIIPTPHVIISFFGDLTFGRATTVIDVTIPAHGNDPASTREAGARTSTSASGGGGLTVQYLF